MTTPDYVQATLDFIDTTWSTTNYSSKPVLIDRRDSRRIDTGERGITFDLTEGNAVSVSDSPPTNFTPEGLGWHTDRVEAGVSVRIEGLHANEYGDVDSAGDFHDLTNEVKRTLKANRKRPLDDHFRLEVQDLTSDSNDNHDYFRADLSVQFVGLESLP